MPNFMALLTQALEENQITVPPAQIQQLASYLILLQTWNQAFNLTAITDASDMVYLHIIDSLVIAPYLQGNRLLDVGSGAGLPGIPLAILNPHQSWVLLDKNGKKTRFLTQAIAELGLSNTTSVKERAEDFHPRTCFDSILSRAYGTLRLFLETTEHLLCPNGTFIAMKGKYPEEELADIPSRFMCESVTRLDIKGVAAKRHIISLKINKRI